MREAGTVVCKSENTLADAALEELRKSAEAFASDGDHEHAVLYLGRLLAAQSYRFGNRDRRTLATRLDLAGQLQSLGVLDAAQRHYDEALRQLRILSGAEDPDVLALEFVRAQNLVRAGDLAAGCELLARINATSSRLAGSHHPATLVYTDALAAALVRLGDLDAAKGHVLRLLDARLLVSSANDCASSLATASVLVTGLLDRNDWTGSLPIQRRIAELLLRTRGGENLDTLRAHYFLAIMLVHSGELESGRTILQTVAGAFSQALGRTHPEVMGLFSLLSTVFSRLGDGLAARAILERSRALLAEEDMRSQSGSCLRQ